MIEIETKPFIVPEGWALVPINLPDEMADADSWFGHGYTLRNVWRELLDEVPKYKGGAE